MKTGCMHGTAIWDHKSDSNWSTLGHFANDDAAKRLEDAENIATTVNNDEGYYTIEMRIPISEQDFGGTPLKNSFLQDGTSFFTLNNGCPYSTFCSLLAKTASISQS